MPRTGRPVGVNLTDPNERFDAKVDRSNPDGCWLWTGAHAPKGYGNFKLRSHKTVQAHRFSFERVNGSLPKGMCVCHRCDNPRCVRPAHLFAGSYADNARDMIAKGRRVYRRADAVTS